MSKTTKRLLFISTFVIGLSYFAFTILFFDPFEDSYMDSFEGKAVAIEYVVPLHVDFFAHKRGLEEDFEVETFPVPNAWDHVRLSRSWRRFEETELYRELVETVDPKTKLDEISAATENIPLLDPLGDVLGRDAAIFGRIAGRGFQETEVCAVFLGSKTTKFAYEAIGAGWLRSLIGAPVEVEEDDEGIRHVTLENGNDFYVYRHLDLFVAGSGPRLVKEAVDLITLGRERSLGYTRRYHGTVGQDVAEFAGMRRGAAEVPEEEVESRLQLHGSVPALLEFMDADEQFLEPRGQVSRWLLARLFNPRYYDDLTLDIGFRDTIDVRGTLGFNRDTAEQDGCGFYDRKTFDLREAMDRVAAILPEDTYLLMTARLDLRQFFPKLVSGLGQVDPAALELLDELIQSIRKIQPGFRATNALDAASTLASLLGQDVVVALKRDTYYGPPTHPSPLVAIFFEVKERGPDFETLKNAQNDPRRATGYNGFIFPIMQAHQRLRQEGRGVAKWYKVWHEIQGSPQERFIQDVILTGTDIRNVSFGIIDANSKDKGPWTLAVTLSPRVIDVEVETDNGGTEMQERGSAHELITDIIKLSVKAGQPTWAPDHFNGGNRAVRPLSTSKKYAAGNDFLEGFASAAIYLDGEGWKQVLRDHSLTAAENATEIDWHAATQKVEQELYEGEYRSWRGKEMPSQILKQFEEEVERRKQQLDQARRMNEIPKAQARYEEGLAWVDLFRDTFLAARIDEDSQNIELRARIRTNLDE